MRHVKVADNYAHAQSQAAAHQQEAGGNGAFMLLVLVLFSGVFCVAFFGPAYMGQCASNGALAELCKAADLAFSTINSLL